MSQNKHARARAQSTNLSDRGGHSQTREIIAQAEYFEGVLPHPEIMAKYEALHPGIIAWMMQRVEKQQDHRMNLEAQAIPERIKQGTRGQVFAFLLGIGTLAVGAYGFYLGRPIEGLSSVIVGISAIAGAFFYGIRRESLERIEKDKVLHGK